MKIIYFGSPYSFSHVTAIRRYGSRHTYISKPTIIETIEHVTNTPNSVAVVPIENTTGGIIHDTVDVLSMEKYIHSNLIIKEELELSVRLFLLCKQSIKLSQVKKVCSHEYALKRSESWIKENLSCDVELIKTISTSEAAIRIGKEKHSCAIASSEAAKHYKLIKLAEIDPDTNTKRNLTRFYILGRNGNTKKRI